MSLNSTVLTASWDAPATQNVTYTLTCSVDSNEVLSLSTTLTEVVVGIYTTEATYSCNVYATISGVDTPATYDMSVTTGGRPKYLNFTILKQQNVYQFVFSQSPVYQRTYHSFHDQVTRHFLLPEMKKLIVYPLSLSRLDIFPLLTYTYVPITSVEYNNEPCSWQLLKLY